MLFLVSATSKANVCLAIYTAPGVIAHDFQQPTNSSQQGVSVRFLRKIVSLCRLCAGEGPLSLSSRCWTCQGSNCNTQAPRGEFASLESMRLMSSATTRVTVPGGGAYKLSYWFETHGGPPNSWWAIIGSVDGSFSPIKLDSLINSAPFARRYQELPFWVPDGTSVITVTLEAKPVRHPFPPQQ